MRAGDGSEASMRRT
ncbi:MAG: hypothetical protein CISAcid_17380 [uncultured Acidilobus sp. CIS]|jgi:hypothetical protein|nr:MAG: hypothetical protein CISAcid_17380 [uncultured Acidilobus sp. CIS]ESQ25617.1 MAG: hypothetical protein JCHSAcid_05540 [uncultured Acidilobus sp. JCHS]